VVTDGCLLKVECGPPPKDSPSTSKIFLGQELRWKWEPTHAGSVALYQNGGTMSLWRIHERSTLLPAGNRKSDELDAEILARLARVDPKLLSPIQHRDSATYPDVAELNSRDLLVRTRTKLINAVRGMIKTAGFRLPSIGPESFASKASPLIPEQLRSYLLPLVQTI